MDPHTTVMIELPLWVAIIAQEVLIEEYEALVRQRGNNGQASLREQAIDLATDIIPLALPDGEVRAEIIYRLSQQRGVIA